MNTNIVIVVSRNHWRCITCKLYSKRVESIDQHLLLQHSVSEKSYLNTPGVKAEKHSYSDGEFEMGYGLNQYKLSLNLLPCKKEEDERLRNNKILPSISPQKGNNVDFRTKQRNCRKQPKKTIKRQTTGFIDEDNCTGLKSPARQGDEQKSNDTKEEPPYQKKSSGINSRKKRAKASPIQLAAVDNPSIQMLEESLPKKRVPSFSVLSNLASPLGGETDQTKPVDLLSAVRSCRAVHVKNGKGSKLDTSDERNDMKKNSRRSKIASRKKSNRVLSYTKKGKSAIDKSKIATCCAPWLFDAGRKAGEKVKKKQRRSMLPEEKDAVRELYGIPSHEQMVTHLPYHGFTGGQCFSVEGQHATTNVSPPTIQSMSSFKVSQGSDPTACMNERSTNMFSSSTHEFFSRSRSFYADYSDVGHQGQTHQFPAEAADVQSSADALQNTHSVGYPCMDQSTTSQFHRQTDEVRQPVNSIYCGQHSGISNLPQHMPFSQSETQSSAPHNAIFRSNSFLEENNLATSLLALASTENGQGNTATKDEDVDVCRVCLQKFALPSEVRRHLQEIARFPVVVCKLCRDKFHGLHELNLHVFSEHEPAKQAFCFTCNKEATGLEDLERHMHKHTFCSDAKLADTKYHDCRICKEELQSSYKVVRIHYYQHHVSHVCCHCFSNFQNLISYQEHCKQHEGKPIMCSICGKEFSGFEELRSHFPCAEDVWAEDGKGSQCSKCGLWCPNRAVVEAHRKQHRSEDDVEAYRKGAQQGFPCVSCEKVFKNKHACRRHIKMVHEGVKCYKHYCEYCGKGFLTKNHMHDHIALHHLGIKRYKCEYCDQHFVCAPTLRRHVRKEHTKHKPYTCEHCGERFFEKTPLQRHLTVHTGLAPFMCEHCGKGFYTKHSFTNHGTTHSASRDFICSGCRKGFTRKYNLQAHMKTCKLV